jgi:hypothetical protein
MFPIGIKQKCFVDKINVTAQLQCIIDKEINSFYHHIPLKKESFDNPYKQRKSNNVTKKIKK